MSNMFTMNSHLAYRLVGQLGTLALMVFFCR